LHPRLFESRLSAEPPLAGGIALIEFVCPSCGKKHKAPDSAGGKVGKCQFGQLMTVF